MSIFRNKKHAGINGLVGIDIGAGGLKLVEISVEKKRAKLLTYGYAELKDISSETSLLDDPKKGGSLLREMLKRAGVKSTRVNTSLPSQSIFHSIITIPQPKDSNEDIQPVIEAQVQKLLPVPIKDVILDFTIIDKHLMPKKGPKVELKDDKKNKLTVDDKKEQKGHGLKKQAVRVLVSGAPKKLVAKYVELFKEAKMNLISLETEAFALIRSLIGKDKARIMVVDIGFSRTNITVINKGIPFLHRSIKIGGRSVTDLMSKQMGISAIQAEQAKRDLASVADFDVIPKILKEAMLPIVHEIKYALNLFNQQGTETGVDKIIITGGSANLPRIDKFIAEELGINVYLGDPWARVLSNEKLRPVLDEIGSRFAVSVGLAMKDLEK